MRRQQSVSERRSHSEHTNRWRRLLAWTIAVLSAARKRNSDDGDGANDSNADGPLREIHAWRARQSDLHGLVTQLDDSGMRAADYPRLTSPASAGP